VWLTQASSRQPHRAPLQLVRYRRRLRLRLLERAS
jgi:hypothetical protein